jgi:hypothetical protein
MPTRRVPASRYSQVSGWATISPGARECAAERRAIMANFIVGIIFQVLGAILSLVSGILHAVL